MEVMLKLRTILMYGSSSDIFQTDFRNFGQYSCMGLLRTFFRQTSETSETSHCIYYVMLWILRRVLGDISDNCFHCIDVCISETFHVDFGNFGTLHHDRCRCTWLKLRWNYLPAGLCWDLGLSNIFGCCLVNSCGGGCKRVKDTVF